MVLPLSRGAARLAAVLDALPDGLVLVNRDGTVVNANTIALGMFETPGTALVGRGLLDLLPTFDSRLIPGSMRLPDPADERGRTKPMRMMARRTDGGEFPVEVTSANLEDGREAYDSYSGYTGDELLMLVVRDLTGTLDTEAELARSQRQTEMILRAASEGVVGTDTDGRVVLVNPAFAQILGYRTEELDGAALHPLVLARRADGTPFPYEESPLADTLKSGRKHRVRGQVLWSKAGDRVPVDLTTAPVRDGDQLVGAVMTFTDRRPYEELIARYEAELAEHAERYAALAARHAELTAVLPEPRPAGPAPLAQGTVESLGRARTAAAVTRHPTTLGTVMSAGIDKATALTGLHRTQFAVHAPPVVVTLDPERASTALAHLIADASGVTSTGAVRARTAPSPRTDTTVVITASPRADHLRIEISGPRAVNDPTHVLIARGIVDAHGGDLAVRHHPRGSGLTYVVQLPHTPLPPLLPAAARASAPAPTAPTALSTAPPSAEPVPGPVPVPSSPVRVPVAGSWIIGAAVDARRDRTAARTRPYATPPRPRIASDGEQQRLVDLLARIRQHPA
ncbi:PAS domain-containing protein [Streptomyces sp. NPDC127049]|uniref:PAS domain-containing protein n=2 Tax=unclassified Streptomyces TaxID=2593676 RepID=UPI003655D46D